MNFRIQRGKDNFLSTRKRQFLVNAEKTISCQRGKDNFLSTRKRQFLVNAEKKNIFFN